MHEDHYIALLEKQLRGELSAAERSELAAWLSASPQHERSARQVRRAWELSEGYAPEVPLDLDADFERLQGRLATAERRPEGAKVVPLHSRRLWLRAAAAILLLVAAPFLVKKYLQPAVQYEVAKAGDSPRKEALVLGDGSEVWLNAGSQLRYFHTSIGQERRVMLQGEAFFKVAKDASKPFIVETPSGEVRVLGTSFNVKDSPESLEVSVEEGKVQMQPSAADEPLLLTANERGVFQKKEKKLLKTRDAPLNEIAWHTRRFNFRGEPLREVAATLEQVFGESIEIADVTAQGCPFNNEFEGKPLSTVLNVIAATFGMEVEKIGEKSWRLKGGRCQK